MSESPESFPQETRSRRLTSRIVRFFLQINLTEQHFLVGVAMVVGIGGGVGAVAFHELVDGIHGILLEDPWWIQEYWYYLPLIPAAGGLAAGLLAHNFAKEAKGAGVSEVMNAMITRQGVIRPRVGIVKALASAFTIGSGGSAGSEGPIIQMGAALGSTVGQIFRFSETNLKTLIACGAAAGISAIFNTPIGGVLFALEVILGDFTIAAFTPVVVSSVFAAVVAQGYYGDHPVFAVPDYRFAGAFEMGWYLVLALLAGIVGVLFIKVCYAMEDFFNDTLTWLPDWSKPAFGGLLVGGIGLQYPEVMGVGYETIGAALKGDLLLPALLILLLFKLLSTPLTIGSGGSGGFFAPSLFIGASLGGAFGTLGARLFPGVISSLGAFALVGMGAVVAATTHAPLTAMLIIFEMTGSYHIMLPLMLVTILAVIVARTFERETIYTLKLQRRGLRIHRGRDLSVLEKIPVSKIVRTDYDFVREHTPLGEMVGLIQHGNMHDFPVIDHEGQFLGMIWFHDIREVMLEDDMYALLIAEDVLGDMLPVLRTYSSLADALLQFTLNDADSLPIFQSGRKLAGVITRSDLMRCYERELLLRERIDGMEEAESPR